MLPTDVFRRILRRALQQEQASFRNNVVSAMMSLGDSLTTPFRLPSEELGQASGTPGQLQLAPVVVKGRCSAVDLLVCPLGSSCKSLRAVHYTRLLQYAELDSLLALAQKVQVSHWLWVYCPALGCITGHLNVGLWRDMEVSKGLQGQPHRVPPKAVWELDVGLPGLDHMVASGIIQSPLTASSLVNSAYSHGAKGWLGKPLSFGCPGAVARHAANDQHGTGGTTG